MTISCLWFTMHLYSLIFHMPVLFGVLLIIQPFFDSAILRIKTLQNRALRIISCSGFMDNVDGFYTSYTILNFYQLIRYKVGLLIKLLLENQINVPSVNPMLANTTHRT